MIEQRSEEWHRQRLGIPTCSQFHRVYTKKGNRAVETARTYTWQLVAEKIFGVPFGPDLRRVKAVQDGIANESPAREALSKFLKATVIPAEFKLSQDRRYGGSPDGYVGALPVEIKCPQIPKALQNVVEDHRDYWPQLQGQLLLHPEVNHMHFWSWSPFVHPGAYYEVRRDNSFCDALHYELSHFCQQIDAAEATVRGMAKFDIEYAQAFLRERRGEGVDAEED